MLLLNLPIATAVTALVTPSYQLRTGPGGSLFPNAMMLQGNFTYGSGGTSADAYVQTSFDGGGTWCDVANFHFLVANARFVFSIQSTITALTQITPTDGSLASNTSLDGIFGTLWRVKYTTVGTYAGNTVMRIDASTNGMTTQ